MITLYSDIFETGNIGIDCFWIFGVVNNELFDKLAISIDDIFVGSLQTGVEKQFIPNTIQTWPGTFSHDDSIDALKKLKQRYIDIPVNFDSDFARIPMNERLIYREKLPAFQSGGGYAVIIREEGIK